MVWDRHCEKPVSHMHMHMHMHMDVDVDVDVDVRRGVAHAHAMGSSLRGARIAVASVRRQRREGGAAGGSGFVREARGGRWLGIRQRRERAGGSGFVRGEIGQVARDSSEESRASGSGFVRGEIGQVARDSRERDGRLSTPRGFTKSARLEGKFHSSPPVKPSQGVLTSEGRVRVGFGFWGWVRGVGLMCFGRCTWQADVDGRSRALAPFSSATSYTRRHLCTPSRSANSLCLKLCLLGTNANMGGQ